MKIKINKNNKLTKSKMYQVSTAIKNDMIKDAIIIVSFKIKIKEIKKDYNLSDIIFLINNEDNIIKKEIEEIKNNKDYFNLDKENLIKLLYKTTNNQIIRIDNNNLIIEQLEMYIEFKEITQFYNYTFTNLFSKKQLLFNKKEMKDKLTIVYSKKLK